MNNSPSSQEEETPLRAELFSTLQMEQHGRFLADTHKLSEHVGPDRLLARLSSNEASITDTCKLLAEAVKDGWQVPPAAEWLLDNFYLIEEQIRTAKRHLPKNYSKQLPRLLEAHCAGNPRVYDIALEMVSHGDGRVDPDSLHCFVIAYQNMTPLNLGELWAIPIMLRLALIENLRRVATRLSTTWSNRKLAHFWAETMRRVAENNPGDLILQVADMARSHPPLESSFVAELVRQLQGQSPALALLLTWLEQQLATIGSSIEQRVQQESQYQAADQVSISNSIGSLRFLSSMDWREFVESISAVEAVLRNDPANVYGQMDFHTRDRYRHVVENISRQGNLSESAVADQAVALASAAGLQFGMTDRRAHIGYYLVDSGLQQLEVIACVRKSCLASIRYAMSRHALPLYLGSILLLTTGVAWSLLVLAQAGGLEYWHPVWSIMFVCLALLPSSQVAQSLVNWLMPFLVQPVLLPRMDLSAGIPPDFSTLVAVPCLLTSPSAVEALSEALEVRFLANQDKYLRFCLLSDLTDADTKETDADAMLVDLAAQQVTRLNHQYPRSNGDYFLLLHRPRSWDAAQGSWIGYERKRGKLGALNALLKQGSSETFSRIVGDTSGLSTIRYVITLDTDTELPRDAARQCVAAMAHPLNRPVYDNVRNMIIDGYGILQPRIAVSSPSPNASRFELLYGGEIGIDPYTRTVSDIYQDLFGEGSFTGKGIYDVDAFEQVLQHRMPENRILSHDLLEGCYLRSGLLSDVQLNEHYPARYSVDVRRRHRWIRGDWQIAAWILPLVPSMPSASAPTKTRHVHEKNPLTLLSRWKLFDNLRRSLVAPAVTAIMLIAWIGFSNAWLWSGALVIMNLLPAFYWLGGSLLHKPADIRLRQHLSGLLHTTNMQLVHTLLGVSLSAYEAWYHLDAIVRTQWRLHLSHRHLLDWNSSGEVNLRSSHDLRDYYRLMWQSPFLAILVTCYLELSHPVRLLAAAPILLIWLFAPAIVQRLSQTIPRRKVSLSDEQKRYLGTLSRKIWLFFETYVGPADNWLAPDNMQEQPVKALARRTSPTNIGLSLLANLSAYDFGYIPQGQLLERTHNTFQTMGALERYQGHFYNWYDTQYLQPLAPIYVSTVDSGNLAGHVLTLIPALNALVDAPIVHARLFYGLLDTCVILQELTADTTHPLPPSLHTALLDGAQLSRLDISQVISVLQQLCTTTAAFSERWESQHMIQSSDLVTENTPGATKLALIRQWARALSIQCRIALEEIVTLIPWLRADDLAGWCNDFPPLGQLLHGPFTLRQLAELDILTQPFFEVATSHDVGKLLASAALALQGQIRTSSTAAAARIHQIELLVLQATEFARMEYSFLYNPTTHLLAIGYNVTEHRRDTGYYDLLASEARLATFVGIAMGQLPQESWFALGRQLTLVEGKPILLSWSGSMFEYLMPLLVMPTFRGTLLDQTYHAVVARQISYGAQRGVNWGVSESGYYAFDGSLNYQYRNFGVPGLGFKRGLADDLVIAPYASMMALMVTPELACRNLQDMSAAGLEGKYGFYEAVDHTPSRMLRGQNQALIRSFMAHHQGMSLLSLAYLLLDRPMQKRFESFPQFRATISLLHERVPKAKDRSNYSSAYDLVDVHTNGESSELQVRAIRHPNTRIPEVQLLSNGRYHVMLTSDGGSYSRWQDLALTRWREDATRDHWGTYCYVKDLGDGSYWSTAYQPTQTLPSKYEVIFSEGRAQFYRYDNNFEMHTEIVVSPEDDIELRRIKISNRSSTPRTIELTSYSEVVLAPAAADAMHQAFSNLFVQTEIDQQSGAILCTRRPRSMHENMPWMFHLMVVHDTNVIATSYETDRMAFIGRGHTPAQPHAMQVNGPLANGEGSVLDPIMAIRQRITLAPEQTLMCDMVIGVTQSRENTLALIGKYQDRHMADRVIELAWTHNQVVLRQLNANEADAQLYGRLANSVMYANPQLRADPSILARNRRGQSALWSYAISGDLPIVLVRIRDTANLDLVRQLVQAHAYWRAKGLAVDLVIWNEDHANYRQVLQDQILRLISAVTGAHSIDRPGGIFARLADQISEEDRILFQSVARIILSDNNGTLAEQLNRRTTPEPQLTMLHTKAVKPPAAAEVPVQVQPIAPAPLFDNGIGGFSSDGREYQIVSGEDRYTPAPWSNVIANAQFGTVISESGQSYSWGENAHEFRLTPWANDPVGDESGEAFYLRDEQSGKYWSPTPLPRRGKGEYLTRHGFGYSVFEHHEDGIFTQLTIYVALDASVKYAVLRVRNETGQRRQLSATGYIEWVLGDLRAKTAMHIVSHVDASTGALFASNHFNTEFPQRFAFFDTNAKNKTFSCDRQEFIGRNRSLHNPLAMERQHLSGRTGPGLDACAAIQVSFDLETGQEYEMVFTLGMGDSRQLDPAALVIASRHNAEATLQAVHHYWQKTLAAVQVHTPDPSLDVLANGWLIYQTLACRMWARSGFYQSGGAFGFRDQIQDAMALVHHEPALAREHLLLCASHQFIEGDVQHWWHPPNDRGVRTHCSDDYLWLPLAVCRYVSVTGDQDVLEEVSAFIEGRPLTREEDSYYDLPARSAQSASLYQHCVRAIRHAMPCGVHGLALIGSCDWNDGMDKVGNEGKGESIWLSFFFYEVLMRFAELAVLHDDPAFALVCREYAQTLRGNIEHHGWDGNWYLRAYFDDGSPLGSASNKECQIDSIAQSWSVLSAAADPQRSAQAMNAVKQRLVRADAQLIQLLDPPFDKSAQNPGYIRGYLPGVRENGGQYTHAAIWAIMAFARLGDQESAWQLLRLINPINHSRTRQSLAIYKVEPYVVAADVYAVTPHTGRGGWTWYTGSAGWMYRLLTESLLGLCVEGNKLSITPCLPPEWESYTIDYRYHDTLYQITIRQIFQDNQSDTMDRFTLDGVAQTQPWLVMVDDRQDHWVEVLLAR